MTKLIVVVVALFCTVHQSEAYFKLFGNLGKSILLFYSEIFAKVCIAKNLKSYIFAKAIVPSLIKKYKNS